MPAVISIGPIAVPSVVLVGLLSVLTGFGAVSLYSRGVREDRKLYFDRLFSGLVIFVLLWKFSPVITDFGAVVRQPALILYAPSGTVHLLIALAGFLLYSLFAFRRSGRNRGIIISFLVFLAVSSGVFAAVRYVLPVVFPVRETTLGQSAPPPVPGSRAPDFTAETLEGTVKGLADYTSSPVILNFWATWCPPCKAEIPELVRFHGGNTTDALLLSVNMTSTERDITAVRSLVLKEGIGFPVILDLDGELARLYGVKSIPTTFLIDEEGRVTAVHAGAVTESWLERELRLR